MTPEPTTETPVRGICEQCGKTVPIAQMIEECSSLMESGAEVTQQLNNERAVNSSLRAERDRLVRQLAATVEAQTTTRQVAQEVIDDLLHQLEKANAAIDEIRSERDALLAEVARRTPRVPIQR